MPPAGFESTIPASEWTQTYALDCVAIGIGRKEFSTTNSETVYIHRWIFIGLLDYS
jgi:hypothetical protein